MTGLLHNAELLSADIHSFESNVSHLFPQQLQQIQRVHKYDLIANLQTTTKCCFSVVTKISYTFLPAMN